MGLWVLAGAWSAGEELDGAVPAYMVGELDGSDAAVDWLVKAGLWEATEDGYRFSSWGAYQPTREDLDERREAERQRKAEWRARRSGKTDAAVSHASRRDTRVTDAGETPDSVLTRPDPTRPGPTPTSNEVGGGTRKRGARIPDEFIVTTEMREWAAREVPAVDVDASTRKFADHWRAESGAKARKVDWVATWRNWLRRDAENTSRRPTPMQRAQTTAAAGRRVGSTNITSLEIER